MAISGGADSVVLLHYLRGEQASCGFTLSAVHCQHGIRGEESVEDMRFVQEYCKQSGVELYVFEADCLARAKEEKCSVETAARAFRQQTFADLIAAGKADYIATAHHQNDEAETVLFRIARGASLSGARGMSERDGWLIRPFLHWSKADIYDYVNRHGLAYRVDSTNFDGEYTRNKLRLEVFPVLEKAVPGAVENFARFASLAAEDDEYLYQESSRLLQREKDGWTVLFCDKKPLFRRACLTVMKRLGVEKDYTLAHLNGVYALQSKQRGAVAYLPKNVRAKKTPTGIYVYVEEQTGDQIETPCLEMPFADWYFDGGRYAVNVACVPPQTEQTGVILKADADKIPAGAVFRFRREGDWIRKFGGGKKSLKKYFNEKKLEVDERAWLPLIAERDGSEVYAVCGVEIADCIRVDDGTKNTVYIVLTKEKRNG